MLSPRIAHPLKLFLVCVIAMGASLTWAPALAQTGPVEVYTRAVDYSAFPDICLSVAPITASGVLPVDLSTDAIQVYENGEPRPVTSISREAIGSQVAIVFDASGSFARPGSTGANRRFDDAIAALDELVLSKDKWLQQESKVDQMLLIAPTGPETFEIAVPWTNEPVAVHNSAYQLKIINANTPLYKMLVESMVRMKDLADYDQRAKFLLVFSDGVDRTSASDVTDVINRANSLGVKILAVKIGPEVAGKTLQRMAEETPRETRADWAYANYTNADSLAPLYSAIKAQAEQYRVCYRSKIKQAGPQSIEVGVKVGDREYKGAARSVSIPVQPASVRIAAPVDGVVYDRIASSWDQDPATLEPREEPVTVEVAWPDNFPRAIERVLYEVDGGVVANLSANEAFTWDFSRLPAGIHSLRAVVRDELGMEGRSDPVSAQINITIPPAPPPAPAPAPAPLSFVEQLKRLPSDQPILLIVLVVALIAAALALYALIRLLRNPQAREAFATTVTNAVRDATEVIRRPRRDGAVSSRAMLVPIDDAETRGDPIPIQWQTTLIGRDPARAQIILADKSVSRLHARIVEESEHIFVLHDEGSSSGTFVGGEQVDVSQPRALKSGDLIEFGRVRVIFQLAGEPGSQYTDQAMEDVTEPLLKRPR
jgi:hypothetical protein